MTGGFAIDDDDLESGDGVVTGGGHQGSGWEFEYDFNIDTFPFHLLPTLTQMHEEEMMDGNVTGHRQQSQRSKRDQYDDDRGHRKNTSTLNVLVEDEVESVRLSGHRDMGRKKRKRRNTTKESLEWSGGVDR